MITVLQMAENLTDAQAAEAVRLRLDWKYCLGLELTDGGFDASVLSEFRTRVVQHGMETMVLDLLVAALVERGLLAAGGKQRTDSTHVVASVRELNRLELAAESVRACVEALAAAAPDWLAATIDVTDWNRRYGARVDSWRLPSSKTQRDALATAYGRDGIALLRAVYAATAPGWMRRLPVLDILRRVLVQNYLITTDRQGREVIRRREADTEGLPPGQHRITSPYDPDVRRGGKRDLTWTGFKLHITETCDATAEAHDRAPNLITNVATTDASVPDVVMTEPIHRALAQRSVLPSEHYVDSGYPSAELLVASRNQYGITLITPLLADTSRQGRAAGGFDRTAFTIDWDTQQVTCPTGHTSTSWTPTTHRDREVIVVKFGRALCHSCPAKTHCTTATRSGRQLMLHPRPIQQALDHARAEQATPTWRAKYALRAGAESTIAQTVKITDTRHARYRGLAKTHLEHAHKAVAVNLIRLHAHWTGQPTNPRHTSHLARLQPTHAA